MPADMPDIERALEELRGILNATYNGAEWLEKHGNVLALIAEVVEENQYLRREIDCQREYFKRQIETAVRQLRFVEAQRDEFLKLIVERKTLEPPPPIIIEQEDHKHG